MTGGKGNYTLDIIDGSEIKFGSWVPQDSFHLKGNAKDVTRGFLATSYKLAYIMQEYLGCIPNRVLKDESQISIMKATGNRFTDWPDDARCLPDGFPCEVYFNGEYLGLYAWQLKKDRKNYSMNKKDYKTFFLDADNFGDFWLGDIPWTQFEIKNPKDLVCMDGSKYDGDSPKELIDSTSEHYDGSNKAHKGSAQTKAIIQSFSTKYLEVKALVEASTQESLAEAKTKFAEYFDVEACIFVYVFNSLMCNADSVNKNTLWGIYSNGKIVPMLWDLDAMYGEGWLGNIAGAPSAEIWNFYANSEWPLSLLWSLYEVEIRNTYIRLRQSNIISMDTWKSVVYDRWINCIGKGAYERDIERWPETPSYRKNLTNTDYWTEVGLTDSFNDNEVWKDNMTYSVGSTSILRLYPNYPIGIRYRAVQENIRICPVTAFYNGYPQVGGFYDSPKRMEKWMQTQMNLCDAFIGYSVN
jgi:hypothetical protein